LEEDDRMDLLVQENRDNPHGFHVDVSSKNTRVETDEYTGG